MKHVSERWLQKLQIFYTIIAALSIAGYFAFTYVPVIKNAQAPALLILPVIILIVEGWLTWREYANKIPLPGISARALLRNEVLDSDAVLNAMTDGVVVIDNSQTIASFNTGAVTITGWDSKEATGLNYHSVIQLIDNKGNAYTEDRDILARSLREGKPLTDSTAFMLSHSKKRVSISISVSPFIENNTVTGAVVVFRDVTAERQIQQQSTDFISTASHEMRTPVAAIEGYLALALNDKVSTIDSRARGFLEKAHSSTQGLGKLFQDLLTSAKADDGRLSNHPSVLEMNKFLKDLSDDLRFTAQKKGLGADFVLGTNQVIDATENQEKVVPPLYYVFADPDRLTEVVTNLFTNATKYTDQGKITIGLTGDENNVQFFIRDTGAGIPAEDIPHLFQRFYRVDNSATRSIGGTGLGLFISKKIVDLYQGRIWVESKIGEGSTFFVNLPRLSSQKAQELKVHQTIAATTGTS